MSLAKFACAWLAGAAILAPAARAAIPIATATIAVSARVLPHCDGNACAAAERVVGYRVPGDPVFELAPDQGAKVLTVTY